MSVETRESAKVSALLLVAFAALIAVVALTSSKSVTPTNVETIYVRNVATQYISDAEIRHDIPAWEKAANDDFGPLWHSTRVKLVFIGRRSAPKGGIVADFVNKGPVKGALAYHTVLNGVPAIVVYAGTDDYYGYSNSVSFTHELFELLADPSISILNQGLPYDFIWIVGKGRTMQAEGTVWANEVCDPVEASSYPVDGVSISDFITPNWFNDGVSGPYDFMGVTQQPFTIDRGGYAQYWNPYLGWQAIFNFRGAGRDANGYYVAEKGGRS